MHYTFVFVTEKPRRGETINFFLSFNIKMKMSGWVSSGEFFGFATKRNMKNPWFLVWERDDSHIITGNRLPGVLFSGFVVTHSARGPGARSDHKF